jgi:hypothetical protein
VLKTQGPAADLQWQAETPDIPSGSVMLFCQAAAPTGWTQVTTHNDVGLRVVSGAGGGAVSGTAFSTVFAQSAVGNTTITQATMPSHTHPLGGGGFVPTATGTIISNSAPSGAFGTACSIGSTGSDGPHTHSVQLALSYVDLILASKN